MCPDKLISIDFFTDAVNCTKAAVEEFPADFLTPKQRQNGGVIIHFLIGMFI